MSLNRLRIFLGVVLLLAFVSGVFGAGVVYGARGHEFGFALGWGVADGEAKLEVCSKASKCEPKPGLAGSGKGQFDVPVGVAVNEATGEFYVLDEANGRVERFSADGAYLGEFNGSGVFEAFVEGEVREETGTKPPTGKLLTPRTLAVDNSCVARPEPRCGEEDLSAGDVYVTASDPEDPRHQVVDKFTAAGEYLNQVQVPLVAPREEGFLELAGVTVDRDGRLWLVEDQGLNHKGFEKFTDAVENQPVPGSFVPVQALLGTEFPAFALRVGGGFYVSREFEAPFEHVIAGFDPSGKALCVVVRQQSRGAATDRRLGDVYVDMVTSVGRFTPECPATLIEEFGQGLLVDGRGVGVNAVVIPGEHPGERDREGPVYVADAGSADVVVFPLEEAKPPTVEGVSVSGVTAGSATLRAVVNPRGARTEYRFEYGVCGSPPACGSSAFEATAEGSVGSVADFEGHEVSVHPQDLTAGATYHFRVLARNEKNAPGEFVESDEGLFRTQPAVPVERLLDGRGWEMVSPAHKHGTRLRTILSQGVIQAAVSGDAFTYLADSPTEDEPKGYDNLVQVLSRRTGAGWASEDLGLSHTRSTGQSIGVGEEYRFFSEDLSAGLVQPFGAFELATSRQASEQTPFLRTNFFTDDVEEACAADCYTPLVTSANATGDVPFGEEGRCPEESLICGPRVEGASPDGREVVLGSQVGLTEGSEGGLYEWSDGTLSLVSVTEEGPVSLASGPTLGGGRVKKGAVSAGGSRVVWTGNSGKSLFLRDVGGESTVEVNKGIKGAPEFQGASVDGSGVFFTDGGDLYVYEVEAGKAIRLTVPVEAGEEAKVQGLVGGVSEDGSYVYYVADGRLDQEARESGAGMGTCAGEGSNELEHCYLYVSREVEGVWGSPRLVGVLSGADFPDFASFQPALTVRVSPDGRWLVFMSRLSLTGYDNRDAVSGVRDEEVFLYDDSSGKTVCVSCDPTGARPVGVEFARLEGGLVAGDFSVWPPTAWLAGNVPGWTSYELSHAFYQSRYVGDSGRVFFDSSDALVAGDVNGSEDVYEFEPEGVGSCTASSVSFVESESGCVGLVSSGSSHEESAFLDAGTSGSDVFFLTASQLVRSDFDSALDVYDAHECTVGSPCLAEAPPPRPSCVTEASCKPPPPPLPEVFGAPPSSTFNGLGDVLPVSPGSRGGASGGRSLGRALGVCRRKHRHSRRLRVICERKARSKFAKTHAGHAWVGG